MSSVNLEWEFVSSTINGEHVPAFSIKRAKIPGGWLVRESTPKSLSMVFVPDPLHKWQSQEDGDKEEGSLEKLNLESDLFEKMGTISESEREELYDL